MNNMNKINIIALSIVVLCLLCAMIGIFSSGNRQSVSTDNSTKKKISAYFSGSTNKIALITIDGVIDSSNKISAFSNEFNAQAALKAIKAAGEDPSIKGILLKMNTPGGTVAMSQSIYHELIRIRANKPVVVLMEDVAASGGYYIAAAADRIIALEGTLTGSVGVIFSTMDVHQLLSQKLFIEPNVIKSGKYKDTGSPYRKMTPDDRRLMEGVVMDSYKQFVRAIEDGRVKRTDTYSFQKQVLTPSALKQNADGRIFTGAQAYKLGFVDSVGDISVAEAALKSMTNEKFRNNSDVTLIQYNKPSGISELLFGATESLFNNSNPFEAFIPTSMKYGKTLMYLWE